MLESSDLKYGAELRIGKLFAGKWRLDQLIGLGGTAAVYAATHRNGSRVAIKVLHRHLCGSQSQVRRFLREAYTANRIGHPGAVAVYDDDIEGEDAFLVMELLAGQNLREHADARGGCLSLTETLKIAHELLDVLEAAHARLVVHRDIKPSNLFLTTSGSLKVLDFGMARALIPSVESQTTSDGEVVGTPAFMAPEQARGRPELVDPRTDVWSVGATLFWLLSGEFVHGAGTATEQLYLTMAASARSLASVRPDLPAPLVEIIDRSLDYDPERRWQDAGSLRTALRSLRLEQSGPSAHTTPDVDVRPLSMNTLTKLPERATHRSEKRFFVVVGLGALFGLTYLVGDALYTEPAALFKGVVSGRPELGALKQFLSSAQLAPSAPESRPSPALPQDSVFASAAPNSAAQRIEVKKKQRPLTEAPKKQSSSPASSGDDELLSTDPLNRRH